MLIVRFPEIYRTKISALNIHQEKTLKHVILNKRSLRNKLTAMNFKRIRRMAYLSFKDYIFNIFDTR